MDKDPLINAWGEYAREVVKTIFLAGLGGLAIAYLTHLLILVLPS